MTTQSARPPLKNSARGLRAARATPVNFLGSATSGTVGNIAIFGGHLLAEMPVAIGLYLSEVIRQAAILVKSSSLVIWFMMFAIGCEVGLQGHYILDQVGAADYAGVFNSVGDLKATAATMWGWILAAKVGCGYVAEIGSMRISDEIDALEVMGIHSRAYLAGTRLWGMWIAAPFLFLTGLGFQNVGSWLVTQAMLETTSPGSYSNIFWSFQAPLDVLYSLMWAILLGSIIAIVGCYYGYTSSGGPVGVGVNTAKSMMVNMIIVSAAAAILYQLFFGTTLQTPIAN